MSDSNPETPKPSRRRKLAFWGLGILSAIALLVSAGLNSIIGQEISAPEWLRADITERVNAQLGGPTVNFGDVGIVLDSDAVPRVSLRNVAVSNTNGERLAVLSDVAGTLALRPLLRGQVQPGTVRLSGATLRLRRSETGALGVAVGEGPQTLEEAVGFTDLIGQLDALLSQPDLKALKRVEADNLTIQYEDARARQAWTVDGGRILLSREDDDLNLRGDFVLLGNRDFATTLEMNYQSQIGNTAAELGINFDEMPARDVAKQYPALAWLEALEAPISGAMRVAVEEEGSVGALNATLQIGEGVLQPTDATRPIPFSKAHAYFTYDPVSQTMLIDEVFLDSKWVTARAEGKAFLVGMEQGLPTEIWSQIRVNELSANPAALYPEPIVIEAATMDTRLKIDPFEVTLGELSLADQGQRLVLTGEVKAKPEGWLLAIDGHMDALSPKRLIELWPESVKDKTRNWIRDNVINADLSNIQLALRSVPDAQPDLFLGFDYEDLETRFIKRMPVIEAAHGHGSLFDGRFVLSAAGGYVTAPQGGRVDIAGTSFVIPEVELKETPAEVFLRTKSTLTAALALLDHEPFGFLTKAGRPVTLADGQAEVDAELKFKLLDDLKPNDVDFDVRATARGVRSEILVPGRVLASPELKITARDNVLRIEGEGRIGRVPANAAWQTEIGQDADGSSTLAGTIELSERFADEFNIGLPPGSISGAGPGQFEIDFAKGEPGIFRLSSDLAGVGLRLKPLGWTLPRAARGALTVVGTLGAPPEIKSIALDAAGLRAEGFVQLKPNGQLERARFERVQVGSWVDAPVELVGRGAGAVPEVRVTGGSIDLRQTSLVGEGDGTSTTNGGPVSLALDSLQISDGIALTDFRADLDMSRGADGSFSGKVNNGANVRGTILPQSGRSAFRIQSDNAGGVLSSAGLLKNAREGQMDLVLLPTRGPGSYNGQLTVYSIRLKDAPALAALLNALSVVGILEQLDGDGIHFSAVEADFQLTPERVTLTEGSAVGASMGISMEGYYFFDRREMDMQGVFSPIYLVNAVGRIFTRKGEGLIGFNYRLNGSPDSPRVRVNPLSVLTPGMFREIFRRAPPEVQE